MIAIFLLAVALAMDAFAVALSQGAVARPAATRMGAVGIGAAFGAAQGVMPLIGWGLGIAFAPLIRDFDHWVAFGLLVAIGVQMVRKGLAKPEGLASSSMPLIAGWALIAAAIATSVDAAAAGVSIELLGYPVLISCAVIALATFVLSISGVMLGRTLGAISGQRAELVGGIVLVGLGCKILIEHEFFGA